MKYTKAQTKALRQLRLTKVNWRNMWVKNHELGYSSKGRRSYEINVAKDYPNKDVRDITLVHEVGHQIYGHLDEVDLKEEFTTIKKILESKNLPFKAVRYYGGPHSFVNIAMDCYINSTLLTKDNCNLMYKEGLEICTPSHFGFEYQYDFRDYYEPLIDRIVDKINEKKDDEESKEHDNNQNNLNGSGSSTNDTESESDNTITDEDFENSDDKLEDNMKDLPETVSSFDDDIDDDVAEEIRREDYNSGDDKAKYNNIKKVNTVEDEHNAVENNSHSDMSGFGNSYYDGSVFKSDETASFEDLKKFLSKIVSCSMELQHDALRHHNHGTRRNSSGILYSSMKRKHNVNKKKLGILIDCSGSMDSRDLIKAINSLKSSMNLISNDSIVVAWDEFFCGEWNINKLPDYVPEGGCTEMSTGVQYLIDKDCNDIIVFSDFGTDMVSMNNTIKSFNGNIYSIIVTNGYDYCTNDSNFSSYIKKNTDYIKVRG